MNKLNLSENKQILFTEAAWKFFEYWLILYSFAKHCDKRKSYAKTDSKVRLFWVCDVFYPGILGGPFTGVCPTWRDIKLMQNKGNLYKVSY